MTTRLSLFNLNFNDKEFDTWFGYLKELYCIVFTIIILRFPETLTSNMPTLTQFQKYEPTLYGKVKAVVS